jgi:hypothetical protein
MAINLFLAHTEYHLLQSINLATTLYPQKHLENIIYVIQTKRRLNDIKRISKIDNIEFKYLEGVSEKEKYHILRRTRCDRFIFFQEDSLANCNLANYYRKKYKAMISLAPDGYKPYAVYKKKHEMLSMLRDTFEAYKDLISKGILPTVFQWSQHYKYASTKFLDEIYLTNPNEFPSRMAHRNISIVKIPEFSEQALLHAGSVFNLSDESFPIPENGIYYFNQPFKEQFDAVEIDFLKDLINMHSGKNIYIKLHPLTTELKKKKYENLRGLKIIETKVPAELFILNLKKSILFTGWSTVLITNNPSCNFYFNLPIYKNKGSKATDQSDLVILPHITLVSKPGEMEFPAV